MLTDAAVQKYRPGTQRRRIRDSKALFLVIEPSGHKAFEMRFRAPGGRIGKLRLGPFDPSGKKLKEEPKIEDIGAPLSLGDARLLAQKVLRERSNGHDPIAEHKARKHRNSLEKETRNANAFAAAVREFITDDAQKETRNWRETARLLGLLYKKDGDGNPEIAKGSLVERWADRPVASIDGADVWNVVDEARRSRIPGTKPRTRGLSEARARQLFVALSSFFSWLHDQRRVMANPCRSAPRPKPAKVRDRYLSDDEIRWFWRAADALGQPYAPLFKLLLLTGARLNEVARMTRSEFSEDGTTWSLLGSRTKNSRPHIVPLAPLARDLIASVPQIENKAGYVFTTKGTVPVSSWTYLKNRLDEKMAGVAKKERADVKIQPWRLHDLRRTAVTGMAELGIRPDVIELVVNHVSGHRGGVAGIYNRAEMLPERESALERWATHIAGLVEGKPAKVLLLHKSART